ncbi:hypothetical protein C1646_765630 [Rhizophagus diaphanus]|nr:hypothetical protein C1646_765630 [Rhizophagus diaphanus] [Rhizophagus sp. MUCL 43196]
MADIYDALEEIKNRHEIEKYIESREEIDEGEEPEMFKKFWKVFQKVILEAMNYNKNTIEKWLEYLLSISIALFQDSGGPPAAYGLRLIVSR